MTINEDLIDDLLTHDYDDERIHQAARALAESERQLGLYAGFSAILEERFPDRVGGPAVEISGAGRLVEKLEQLEALPAGTVVIERDGTLAEAFEMTKGAPIHWFYFGTDYYGSSRGSQLPARIVFLGVSK